MKDLLKYALVTSVLALGATAVASATPSPCATVNPNCRPTFSAPEIEPGLAIVGLSLLAGTIAVMRARRRS